MAQQTIGLGATENDDTGDNLRTAGTKINANFSELYAALSGKQGSDALLAAIAALTTSANQMIYLTGADTVALATLTAAARNLLDDADAAAMRATLGLVIGTNVQAQSALLSKLASDAAAALTPGATVTMDCTSTDIHTLTPNQNTLIANPTGLAVKQSFYLWCTQDSTARTFTYGDNFIFPAGTPTLPTGAGDKFLITGTRVAAGANGIICGFLG